MMRISKNNPMVDHEERCCKKQNVLKSYFKMKEKKRRAPSLFIHLCWLTRESLIYRESAAIVY